MGNSNINSNGTEIQHGMKNQKRNTSKSNMKMEIKVKIKG